MISTLNSLEPGRLTTKTKENRNRKTKSKGRPEKARGGQGKPWGEAREGQGGQEKSGNAREPREGQMKPGKEARRGQVMPLRAVLSPQGFAQVRKALIRPSRALLKDLQRIFKEPFPGFVFIPQPQRTLFGFKNYPCLLEYRSDNYRSASKKIPSVTQHSSVRTNRIWLKMRQLKATSSLHHLIPTMIRPLRVL